MAALAHTLVTARAIELLREVTLRALRAKLGVLLVSVCWRVDHVHRAAAHACTQLGTAAAEGVKKTI